MILCSMHFFNSVEPDKCCKFNIIPVAELNCSFMSVGAADTVKPNTKRWPHKYRPNRHKLSIHTQGSLAYSRIYLCNKI